MGRRRWRICRWLNCDRDNFRLKHDSMHLQSLPKPKEADSVDGVPYIDAEKESDILIVRTVIPCIAINGALHHTAKYELMTREYEPSLVIRRGQPFRIDVELSRPYREDTDGVSFIFTVDDEEKPSYGQGTLVPIALKRKEDKTSGWNAVLETSFDNRITVQITPAADCVVAKWKLEIDTKIVNDGAYSYSWSTGIFILYNPWCKQDQVYMKSDEWKQEAVLEDVGLIWRGTSNRLRPCIWKYGQFDKNVLECSLYLIKYVGKVHGHQRADPVETSRALTAAVNSIDDNGAVMGNWSEVFTDGTPPTKWIGSTDILQEFYRTKKSVKYGQCWVFSGVVSTICRAIGIPSRPVTNYSSAHDTQSSLTVDYFLNNKGKIMEELNSDSIWNFHVWNEAWMERPDLGKGYGGWQAIDATPQELSGDMYRCGPASLVAVKNGEVKRPYDCSFVFAEVNADKVFWKYEGITQPLKLLRNDIRGIGKLISTKAAGEFQRIDISHLYKHPEETEAERSTMLKALKQAENMFSRYYLNEEFNDIQFNFILLDDIKIGEPFNVSLEMHNKSFVNSYKVSVNLRVDVMSYRGKIGDAVKEESFNVTIEKNSIHELKLSVTYDEYFKRLLNQAAFNISCLATVEDTKFEYYAQDDFRVRKPDVKIVLHDSPVEDIECSGTAYLVNPLPVTLRKAEIRLEGADISETFKIRDKVGPGEKALVSFKVKPNKFGKHTIAAKFTSKELDDCDGYFTYWVDFRKEQNGVET